MRTAVPGDVASLLRLKQRLDRETSLMLLEAGERGTLVQALGRQLEEMARSGNPVVIVAEIRGDLAGYVELAGGAFRRNRATAEVVIGVLAEVSGSGVGAGLLREAKRWAAAHGLHRLELTVMAHNRRAVDLYERGGFSVEGRAGAQGPFSSAAGSSVSFIWRPSFPAATSLIRPNAPVGRSAVAVTLHCRALGVPHQR